MKIDGKRFYFAKTKTGKKFHVFPINHSVALCFVNVNSATEDRRVQLPNVCKICKSEYLKVKNNAIFQMFVS